MRSVFVKIYLAFMVTALVTTAVTITMAAYYRQWSNDSVNLLAPTGGYISAAELILQQGGEPLLLEWLLRFERHPSVNAYVFDAQGLSLLPNPPAIVLDYALSADSYEAQISPLSRSEILVKAPIESAKGQVYLLVVEFMHPLVVFNLPAYLGWGLLASFLIFAVWSFVLSGYLTLPVRYIQHTVSAFADGNWRARIDERSLRRRDELGELSREFNHMAGYIERLIHDQRQLVSDISHELRSPLARSTVALELARLDAVPDQEEHLDRIELENQRLNDMIEDLLNMAKLDTQQDHRHWENVFCGAVLEQVIGDARFEHPESIINLTLPPELPAISGDQKFLKSAFENIIRNALLHTKEGTSVDIAVSHKNNELRIVIRDHGPGVPRDKLNDLLRPFVRVETARERLRSDHRGFGLGLAIAHRVVSHHRGQIGLGNHRDGGLMVTIQLPLAT